MPLDQVSASYMAAGSVRTNFPKFATNLLSLQMALFNNKPARSSHIEKICLWTKFQPPTWLLALSGPVFLFRPLNKLPYRWRYQKINNATLCALKKSTFCQSFILLLQKFKQLWRQKPANSGDPVSTGTERFIEKGNLLASLGG